MEVRTLKDSNRARLAAKEGRETALRKLAAHVRNGKKRSGEIGCLCTREREKMTVGLASGELGGVGELRPGRLLV